jgi:hypothetical protein
MDNTDGRFGRGKALPKPAFLYIFQESRRKTRTQDIIIGSLRGTSSLLHNQFPSLIKGGG